MKKKKREYPTECWSASEEFFIRNDLGDVVDNEGYAMSNWGKGTYIKVIRPFVYKPRRRKTGSQPGEKK